MDRFRKLSKLSIHHTQFNIDRFFNMLARKIAAWGVHIFTASGLLTGFLALIAIGEKDWKMAFIWLFVSFLIDGVDGTFARLFKVKEVLPQMDGKNIDFVIDFANYAIFPAYFFYMAEMVPEAWMYPCLAMILLSSAIYYGKDGMVADEQYFVGFPVLWNLLVFVAFFVLGNQPWLNVGMVIVFAILHFVPLKYAYPSRSRRFFWMHIIASTLWFFGGGIILYFYPERLQWAEVMVILIGVYFGVFALIDTFYNRN